MKWAVISDIHANLMALQEVVNHIKTQGVNGILCTGDLVVFGPHPNECVELIFSLLRERWDKRCMMGNNDQAVVLNRHSEGLSRIAIVSQKWTSRVVSAENRLRLSRLSKAPIIYKNHWTIVHGTLSDPIGEFTYMTLLKKV